MTLPASTLGHYEPQGSMAPDTCFDHFFSADEARTQADGSSRSVVREITVRSAADFPAVLEALSMADDHQEVSSMLKELRLLVGDRDAFRTRQRVVSRVHQDRRRANRFDIEPMSCTLEIPRLGHSRLCDISRTGLRVEALERAQIGVSYPVVIECGGNRFEAEGKVVWCQIIAERRLGTTVTALVHQFGLRFERSEMDELVTKLSGGQV